MNKVHLVLVIDVDVADSEWAKALVAQVWPFVVERFHQQAVEVEKTVAVEKVMVVVVNHVHEVEVDQVQEEEVKIVMVIAVVHVVHVVQEHLE